MRQRHQIRSLSATGRTTAERPQTTRTDTHDMAQPIGWKAAACSSAPVHGNMHCRAVDEPEPHGFWATKNCVAFSEISPSSLRMPPLTHASMCCWARVGPLVSAIRTASWRNSPVRFSPLVRLIFCSKCYQRSGIKTRQVQSTSEKSGANVRSIRAGSYRVSTRQRDSSKFVSKLRSFDDNAINSYFRFQVLSAA
jgi:hypothetical protein